MSIILNNSNINEIPENSTSNNLARRRSSLNWVNKFKNKNPTIGKSQVNIETEISAENMIAKAKIHREANRPLIKLKEFDGNTKFCQCCYLPAEDGE